ncbi:hypothetical protein GIB67_014038 [Kingdonia uniflora]|uniref:Uncharacterized protein n=1 Tax=Kingdonia uniflora TaxID=39325 RepID=A0A7J7L4K9_9MAGN|nr:hypothetical protein GIB67_014038 [Kingdonia uniflora]
MLINVPLSIELEQIIGQTEPSAELRFEPQPEQVKDLVDFRFKSVVYTKIPMTSVKSLTLLYDPICHQVLQIWHFFLIVCHFFKYGVAYTNHVESWNSVILKVRNLPIHVFIYDYIESVWKCPTRIGRKLRRVKLA